MKEYKKIKQDLVYKGNIIEVYKETVELPNEKQVHWDFVKHKGASAVIAIDEDDKIIMVRQYRNAIDRMSLEIPAGGIQIGEDPKVTALRELEEETGYQAKEIEHLMDVLTAVGFTNETLYLYVTKGLIKTEQHLDEDEFVTIERYGLEELIAMIMNGTIQDAKTIAGIFAYREKYVKK
ncbi:MAG: NUDIX hydrolase [Firmicutes bacterium]|uniref:NUDIX hydrolase n=1 Tax=Candidatus Scybalomonas excrementavium TaxID=2840943 RepID=A0A9D9N7C5_9FIRM|nr:NUDIX hydrolase [Candidatus Scybalomonas excrementavium]